MSAVQFLVVMKIVMLMLFMSCPGQDHTMSKSIKFVGPVGFLCVHSRQVGTMNLTEG